MSLIYFLTPYKPKESHVGVGEFFKIDVQDYKQKLLERWKDMEFFSSSGNFEVLLWAMPSNKDGVAGTLMQILSVTRR